MGFLLVALFLLSLGFVGFYLFFVSDVVSVLCWVACGFVFFCGGWLLGCVGCFLFEFLVGWLLCFRFWLLILSAVCMCVAAFGSFVSSAWGFVIPGFNRAGTTDCLSVGGFGYYSVLWTLFAYWVLLLGVSRRWWVWCLASFCFVVCCVFLVCFVIWLWLVRFCVMGAVRLCVCFGLFGRAGVFVGRSVVGFLGFFPLVYFWGCGFGWVFFIWGSFSCFGFDFVCCFVFCLRCRVSVVGFLGGGVCVLSCVWFVFVCDALFIFSVVWFFFGWFCVGCFRWSGLVLGVCFFGFGW